MFDPRTRRHPVQTFQFWFVVLTSFVVVTIWKLDLLSFPHPLPELVEEEPMPPPPGGEANAVLAALAPSEASTLPEQPLETTTDTGPLMSPVARQLADHAEAQEQTVPSVAEQQNPVEPAETPPPSGQHEGSFATSPVITVSAESAPKMVSESSPPHPQMQSAEVDLTAVDRLVQQGEEVAAQRLMSGWFWKKPECRTQLMGRLNVLARRIYFQNEIHYTNPYPVQFGDQLEKVAETCQVTPEYLMRLNRLESPTLKVGQVLKVIQGPFGAVVHLGRQEMTIHAQGYFVAQFQLKDTNGAPLTQGKFRIVEKHRPPNTSSPLSASSIFSGQSPGLWMRLCDVSGTGSEFKIYGETYSENSLPGGLQIGDRELAALFDLLMIGSEIAIHP